MNPLTCTACRPIWQEFRKVVEADGIAPEQRRHLITEYLRLVHAADHDEAAVLAELQAHENRRREAARWETATPRQLPMQALVQIGAMARTPGWAAFLMVAQDAGFGLAQPGDHDLSDADWEQIASLRVATLIRSFEMARAR